MDAGTGEQYLDMFTLVASSALGMNHPALADDDPSWNASERILLSTEPFAFRARDADALGARYAKPAQLIDGEWTSWYGPRAIEGLRELAEFRVTHARARGA